MVILYTSTGCPKCNIIKKGLEKKGIDYFSIENEEEIVKRGITSIPVLEIDGKRMYYPEAFNYVKNYKKEGMLTWVN